MHRSMLCLLSLLLDISLIFTVIISVVINSLINKYPALSLIIFLESRSVRFRNSLVVQWLVFSSFMLRAHVQSLIQELRSFKNHSA